MKLFKKKPVHVQAVQWNVHGDHPEVLEGPMLIRQFVFDINVGTAVEIMPREIAIAPTNGWIPTLENAHEVSPGDWIIRGVRGEYYPCKPDIFNLTYDEIAVEDVVFEEVFKTAQRVIDT